jgi:glucose/arabinose dehydrogenase
MRKNLLLLFIFVSYSALSQPKVPDGFVPEQIFSGRVPVSMALDPLGRIFITEKNGNILFVTEEGKLIDKPLITLPVDQNGERGVEGIVVDPEFIQNHYVYVYYTLPIVNRNRLSRFVFHEEDLELEQEYIMFEFEPMMGFIHNGGNLKFGPDSKLYVSTGDGSIPANAQSQNSLLGKILRLNADGSIPTDNPFYSQNNGIYRAIYALGFRNPFSYNFDKNGKLFVNDVGNTLWEEVNDVRAGKNYGWPTVEGALINNPNVTPPPNYVDPIYSYSHKGGCAVTGSAFIEKYNSLIPDQYTGKYIFGDFCNDKIWMLDPATNAVTPFIQSDLSPICIQQSSITGDIYFLTWSGLGGSLWKVKYGNDSKPHITIAPVSQIHSVGESARLSVGAIGDKPLTYQWMKNGEIINGADSSMLLLQNLALSSNNDSYTCVVSNSAGSVESQAAIITVTNRSRPVVNIQKLFTKIKYSAGDTIIVKGSAFDEQEGNLPATDFTWKVDFHHNLHAHPVIQALHDTDSLAFIPPVIGEVSPNVWYEIDLTAINSVGLTQTATLLVYPKLSKIIVLTSPADSVMVSLDDAPRKAPYEIEAVAGMTRSISVAKQQIANNDLYYFKDVNSVSKRTIPFTVPQQDTTFLVSFDKYFLGKGKGLTGKYYNQDKAFGGVPDFTRLDPVINFNWIYGSPSPTIRNDRFTIVWQGLIRIPFDGDYTFYSTSDDGVRVVIDEDVVIDAWIDKGPTEISGTTTLQGGIFYPISIYYYEAAAQATISFSWSSNRIQKMVVPTEVLYDQYYPLTVVLNADAPEFSLNKQISFTADVKDFTGATVPLSNLKWSLNYVTGQHSTELVKIDGVQAVNYTLPDTIKYDASARLKAELFAKDDSGFVTTKSLVLPPKTAEVLITSPKANEISLDNLAKDLPFQETAIAGYRLEFGLQDSVLISDNFIFVPLSWKESHLAYDFHVNTDTTVVVKYDSIKLGGGDGLIVKYYSANKTFASTPDSVLSAKQIDFSYHNIANGLKVEWSGWITPPVDGDYLLSLEGSPLATLKINGALITNGAPISLKQNAYYYLEVRYESTADNGWLKLSWANSLFPKHIIPKNQLYQDIDQVVGTMPLGSGAVKVYPNPVSELLTIEYENIAGQELRLKLFDGQGRQVNTSTRVEDTKRMIDVSTLSKGFYYLLIQTNTNYIVRKIFKQ